MKESRGRAVGPWSQLIVTPSTANDRGSPNPLTNMDGFGVGWWTTGYYAFESGCDENSPDALRPVVYHSTRPPLNDRVLASLARGVSTPAILAHIRAGTGLTPVVETNCHPFPFGRHLFAHNGVLGSFHLFKVNLLAGLPLRYQQAILGTTDSEHIAALYFLHLCGPDGDWEKLHHIDEMTAAMEKTVSQLRGLKRAVEQKNPPQSRGHGHGGGGSEPTTLNLVVSSGRSLVAIRYSEDREAPSLYYSTVAGATINRKFKGHPDDTTNNDLHGHGLEKSRHGEHIIVASEPSTLNSAEWELLPEGKMIAVDEDMKMEVKDIVLGDTEKTG